MPRGEVVRDGDPEDRIRRPTVERADHLGDERVGVAALLPGDDRQDPGGGRRARTGGRRLQARRDERPVAVRRDDEHRQPLERRRRVAGEIVHVGSDPDQDRGEARLGREVARGGHPVAVALGRDRWVGTSIMRGDSTLADGGDGRRQPAAIWRGPSSNSRRYGWTRSAPAASARRRSVGVVVLADGEDRPAGGVRERRSPRRRRRPGRSGRR